jgi:hypothetical protein
MSSGGETGIAGFINQKEKWPSLTNRVAQLNSGYFENEACKLDGWGEYLKLGLGREMNLPAPRGGEVH